MVVAQGKLLRLGKAQHRDSGLYECVARNGVDQDLRRIIQVKVRGKCPLPSQTIEQPQVRSAIKSSVETVSDNKLVKSTQSEREKGFDSIKSSSIVTLSFHWQNFFV